MRVILLACVFAGGLWAQVDLAVFPPGSVAFTSPDGALCVASSEGSLDTAGMQDRPARVSLFRNDASRAVLWSVEKLHLGRVLWLAGSPASYGPDTWVAEDGRPFSVLRYDGDGPLGLMTRDGRRLVVLDLVQVRRRTFCKLSIYNEGVLQRTFSNPDVSPEKREAWDVAMSVRRGGSFDRQLLMHGPGVLRIRAHHDAFNTEYWEFNIATAECVDRGEESRSDLGSVKQAVRNRAWPWLPVAIGTTLLFAALCLVGRRRKPVA